MANFTDNTTQLQNLLAKVNALPEAGSGGGSVETCTVTISMDSNPGSLLGINESGVFDIFPEQVSNSTVYEATINIYKNSMLIIYNVSLGVPVTSDGITLIKKMSYPAAVFHVCSSGSIYT